VISMLALLLAAPTGCGAYTPPLAAGDRLKSGYGYVYGRFTLKKQNPETVGHLRAGLVLETEDQSASYTIQFNLDDTPTAIAVRPGTYSLSKITFANWLHQREGEKPITDGRLTVPFTLVPVHRVGPSAPYPTLSAHS